MITALGSVLFAAVVASSWNAEASFINYSSKEINLKIVYYGPASADLSENLQYIYEKTAPEAKGKLISLDTETDKAVFFDFLPLSLGEIRGFKVRFHLYTVPGAEETSATKKLILKGVDGVVFVADCDPAGVKETIKSWRSLKRNLKEQGYDWKTMPLVVQLENHDSRGALSSEAMRKRLGLTDQQTFETDPDSGVGVFDSLKQIAKEVLTALKSGAESE